MAQRTLRGIEKETQNQIQRKPKKKVSPANFLRKLAGGWTRKEAKNFMEAIRSFEHLNKTMQR